MQSSPHDCNAHIGLDDAEDADLLLFVLVLLLSNGLPWYVAQVVGALSYRRRHGICCVGV